jgi:hypothetical protein
VLTGWFGAGRQADNGRMAAVLIRVRAELRHRWQAWTVIALLIGFAGGVVLTAASGARRTDTAYSRLLRFSHAADVVVSPQNTGLGRYYDALGKLPGVTALGPLVGISSFTTGPNPIDVMINAGPDGRYGTVVDRPKISEGRMFKPARPDEAVAERNLARLLHLHTGSVLSLVAAPSSPTGPDFAHARTLNLRIVGVGVTRDDPVSVNALSSQPALLATPALLAQFDPSIYAFDGAAVLLRPGVSRAAFQQQAQALAARFPETGSPLFVADEHQQAAKVEGAIRPQAVALGIFSLLAAATALLVIGQMASRQLFLASTDNPVLRAIGMSRRHLTLVGLLEMAAAALAGTFVAVVLAVAASPWTPIGPARIAEPHPGVAANWGILGLGALGIMVLMLGWVAWPAWRLASSGAGRSAGYQQPSRVLEAASRSGAPPSVAIGVGLALEPGRGRTAVPVRSALAGTVVATTAVAAAFTFGTNLAHLVRTPRLYGQTWNVAVDSQFGQMSSATVADFLGQKPGVTGWTFGNHTELTVGNRHIPAIRLAPGRGPQLWPTVVEGRAPETSDEVVLGTKTLKSAHLNLGQTIDAQLQEGTSPRPLRIVGRAVFPFFGHGSFTPTGLGEGAAVRDAVPDRQGVNFFLARLAPGTPIDPVAFEAVLRQLNVCPGDQACGVFTAQRPVDITNYARIQGTPLVLAGVLAVLAVGTLAHLLITSIRRRRRDLAVLKTLGFLRGQISAAVAWQASILVALALLIGLPVGVAAGRWVWMLFASRLGVPADPLVPFTFVIAAIPVALVLANALAAGPGLVAGRLSPASVLRHE